MNKIKDTIATKKDFRVETYRGKGKGGQKRNKTDSAGQLGNVANTGNKAGTRKEHLKVDNWMREENLKVEYYTPSE